MSDLIELALDAHGGLERWQRLETVTARIAVTGALFTLKGYPDGLGTLRATADTTTPRLTFTPFAGSARGAFEPDRVTVTAEDGAEQHRENPRAAGLEVPLPAPWDELHLLYFAGYAMWNYLCTPFVFTWPGFATEEIEPWQEGAETWRRLRVTFPPNVPTHNPEQVFHFDQTGLLRRLDYAPEVLDSTPAAHYCDDHRDFSGLVVPTRRTVHRRDEDGTADEQSVIELGLSDVTVA